LKKSDLLWWGFGKFWKLSRMRFLGFGKSLENVKDEVYCLLLMDKMSNWFITFIVGKKNSF